MKLLRAASMAVAGLVAGCGNQSENSPVRQSIQLARAEIDALFEDDPPAAPPVTAEQIAALPFATILVGRPGNSVRSAMFAVSVNGLNVTYSSPARQTVTLRGGALASTHGLTIDLAGYRSDVDQDPLIRIRPPEAWPQEVVRAYRDRDAYGAPFSRTLICRPQVLGPRQIVIAETPYDVVEIEEPCRSPSRFATNRYWVEPATGFVRASEQWMGPRSGSLTIEIAKGLETP